MISGKKTISKKIILTGSFNVGKTSLISRFVYQKFPYSYQTTLGVRIDRKRVDMDNANINMIIWDVGGEQSQSRIPTTYYLGSSGVIYVFDLTRPGSFFNMTEDIDYIKKQLPRVPIIIVGNKTDLLDEITLEEVKGIIPLPVDFYTSAREGLGVEKVFLTLAEKLVNGGK